MLLPTWPHRRPWARSLRCGAAVGHSSPCPIPRLPQPPSPALGRSASRSWLSSANPLILPPGGCGAGAVSSTRDAAWEAGEGESVPDDLATGGWEPRGGDTPGGGWGRALPAQEFPIICETKPKLPPKLPPRSRTSPVFPAPLLVSSPPLLPSPAALPLATLGVCGVLELVVAARGCRGRGPPQSS